MWSTDKAEWESTLTEGQHNTLSQADLSGQDGAERAVQVAEPEDRWQLPVIKVQQREERTAAPRERHREMDTQAQAPRDTHLGADTAVGLGVA